jgi:uncharacterized protein YceH (UPF0502 family)
MPESLNEIERRVVGVLIEKSMAAPEYYPMTLNAIVTACNQKNNRDPVMDLDESSVEYTLEELRKRGLVSIVLPGPGARTNRYKHEIAARFGWEKRVTAVMTELLLRGPQTPGELRSRCARLVSFESLEAVMTTLDYLQNSDPPLVRPLPRQAGQSAVRYLHLLYPPEEIVAIEATEARAAARSASAPAAAPAPSTGGSASSRPATAPDELRAEVDQLKAEVARLSAALADLQQRFSALESELR